METTRTENFFVSTSYKSTAVLNLSSTASSPNTSSETLVPAESPFWCPPSAPLSHSECHKHLKNLGFSWEDDEQKNWNISTIWEPSVLKEVSIFQEMKKGEETVRINLESLNDCVIKGFKVFRKHLPTFVSSSSNYIAIRIEEDDSKTKYCEDTDTALFQCTEILVGEGDTNFSTLRCTPSILFIGGQLAEILGELLRPKDILVVLGPFKKHHYGNQRIVILNFDAQKEQVSIIRFSHLHPHQAHQVRMLENISPSPCHELSLCFDYILMYGENGVLNITKKFAWHSQLRKEIRFLAKDIPMPIAFNQDVLDAYYKIVDHSKNNIKSNQQAFKELSPIYNDSPVFFSSPIRKRKEMEEEERKETSVEWPAWLFLGLLSCFIFSIFILVEYGYNWSYWSTTPSSHPPKTDALCILPQKEEAGLTTVFAENVYNFIENCVHFLKSLIEWLYNYGGVNNCFWCWINSNATYSAAYNGPIV